MIYLVFRICVMMWYLMKMLRSRADPCLQPALRDHTDAEFGELLGVQQPSYY